MRINLQSPVLFLVIGNKGSGKTYLSQKLSLRLKTALINEDEIKRYLQLKNDEEDTNNLIFKVSKLLILNFFKQDISLICDLSLKNLDEIQQLNKLAEQYKYKLIVLYQQIDAKMTVLRNFHRLDNVSNFNLKLPTQYEVIVLAGSHSFKLQAKTIFRRLFELDLLSKQNFEKQKIIKPSMINLIHNSRHLKKDLKINLNQKQV